MMFATDARKISLIKRAIDYILASAGVALLTATIHQFHLDVSPANVPILYLLVVTLSAVFSGRGAAIWASVCSFLAINWFFVTPRYTFTVQEPTEWIALCIFLFTAIVTSQLMALLKARASEARQHQRETAALSEASWAVASRLDTQSALVEVVKQVAKVVDLKLAAIIASENGETRMVAAYPHNADLTINSAHLLANHERNGGMCLPIEMNEKTLGAVYIKLGEVKSLSPQQKQIIDSLVNHSAVILQRDGLIKTESQAAALADADRLKTALLTMVSHDFRSPLTSIKACVSTLLSEGQPLDSETQRGLYQAIEQEADRLNRIVGNILDLSRLEANAWRPKIDTTPVSELIGMALDPFSADCNRRIVVKLDQGLSDIFVDCVQMVQVLKNLVENALKYSPTDSLVEIQTGIENHAATIEILDRGRGLSTEEMAHIFEPFYRGSGLQESSVPGVGIGLAVCRGLVEAHGGTLTAENRIGGGAIFRISLLLKHEAARSVQE